MKDPRIVAYMSSVGVSVHDVQHLFKIVANENDEVDIDRAWSQVPRLTSRPPSCDPRAKTTAFG